MPQRPGHNNYTTESYISHLWNGPLRHDIAQIENAKNAFAMEDLLQICNIRGKMFSRTNLFSEFLFVYKIKEVLLPTCLFLLVNVNCYFCQGEKRHLEILILTEVRYLDLWLWLSLQLRDRMVKLISQHHVFTIQLMWKTHSLIFHPSLAVFCAKKLFKAIWEVINFTFIWQQYFDLINKLQCILQATVSQVFSFGWLILLECVHIFFDVVSTSYIQA